MKQTAETTQIPEEQPKKTSSSCLTACLIAGIVLLALSILCVVGIFLAVKFGWQYIAPQLQQSEIIKQLLQGQMTGTTEELNRFIEPTRSLRQQITPSPEPIIQVIVTATPTPIVQSSTDDYVIPYSNTRYINEGDLVGLTPWQLKVARNEIYARHGRPFVHKDLACYFATKSWYRIDSAYTDSRLSSLETTNAVTILNYEKKIGSPLMNVDSGCNR